MSQHSLQSIPTQNNLVFCGSCGVFSDNQVCQHMKLLLGQNSVFSSVKLGHNAPCNVHIVRCRWGICAVSEKTAQNDILHLAQTRARSLPNRPWQALSKSCSALQRSRGPCCPRPPSEKATSCTFSFRQEWPESPSNCSEIPQESLLNPAPTKKNSSAKTNAQKTATKNLVFSWSLGDWRRRSNRRRQHIGKTVIVIFHHLSFRNLDKTSILFFLFFFPCTKPEHPESRIGQLATLLPHLRMSWQSPPHPSIRTVFRCLPLLLTSDVVARASLEHVDRLRLLRHSQSSNRLISNCYKEIHLNNEFEIQNNKHTFKQTQTGID
jgi:hypothetical protein